MFVTDRVSVQYIRVSVRVFVCLCFCVSVFVSVCLCVSLCPCVCVSVCLFVSLFVFVCLCPCVCVYTYVQVWICESLYNWLQFLCIWLQCGVVGWVPSWFPSHSLYTPGVQDTPPPHGVHTWVHGYTVVHNSAVQFTVGVIPPVTGPLVTNCTTKSRRRVFSTSAFKSPVLSRVEIHQNIGN